MSVFMMCERAVGLLRGNRLELNVAQQALLEALDYVGLIASYAQEEAVTCARHFENVRDRLLQIHPWVFARKSAAPAQLSDPVQGWRHAYALPMDCLKVLALIKTPKRLYDLDVYYHRHHHRATGAMTVAHWEQLGRTFCCNYKDIQIRYTARIEDTESWNQAPSFVDAFCATLAGEMAVAISGDANLTQLMAAKAQSAIIEAHRTGAVADAHELPEQRDLWMDYSGVPSGFDDAGTWGY
jgi:hypothetical protein